MIADFGRLPTDLVHGIADEVISFGKGKIDAVFLDVTSKPPATIEWE